MEEAVRHVKTKGLNKETIDQTNHVRLNKKVLLPMELVGATERLRTEAFDKINSASQMRWKFEFTEGDSPGPKLRKVWEHFKQWTSTNEHQTVKDLEEMSVSAFKISDDGETCRHKTEEGEHEHYKKQKESENYFKREMRSDEIEWKSIRRRKCKRRVMKVIGPLGVEADIETENLEQSFNEEMQQLLKRERLCQSVTLLLKT